MEVKNSSLAQSQIESNEENESKSKTFHSGPIRKKSTEKIRVKIQKSTSESKSEKFSWPDNKQS